MLKIKISLFFILLGFMFGVGACHETHTNNEAKEPTTKEALGELLFSDPILSQTNLISCASCHLPQYAFSDTVAFSKGVNGKLGIRNTPSAMNLSARNFFFHDGRSESLEEQASGPMENPIEMNLPVPEIIKKLIANENYIRYFKNIYHETPNNINLMDALASFERTLETGDTPFDQFMHNDTNAITEAAKRGQQIFNKKGKCFDCHFGPDFTGDDFKNIGLYNGKELNDLGRYTITKDTADVGKFKVPGLRNIAVTAPYMHNGMFRTLREVIDYYNTPTQFVTGSINTDSLLLKPLNLSEQEKLDLLAFLKALTDNRFKQVAKE
jgi:cytochrome c peroxidase